MKDDFSDMIFTGERVISSAFIDSSVRMGIAQSVLMVQDNLTECFGALGCDGVVYREKFNSFWVFTKTKIQFVRRPAWRETVLARTFPVDNAGFKTHINTVLSDAEGKTLLLANQEACVLDCVSHRPVKLSALPYPSDRFPEKVFSAPFEKFSFDFSEDDFRYEQLVRSQHIDMSHHLNNIEYIKLGLNVFGDEFLRAHDAVSLEVHYTGESCEGQMLRVYSKTCADTTDIAIKESGRTVFEMRIVF